MKTPSIGLALWPLSVQWLSAHVVVGRSPNPPPNPHQIDALAQKFARVQGFEGLGLNEEAVRELDTLPPGFRELPLIAIRRAKLLERIGRFAEALDVYEQMDPVTLAHLGRVRCLARLRKSSEARRIMAGISFDPALVKEFVETRDLLR